MKEVLRTFADGRLRKSNWTSSVQLSILGLDDETAVRLLFFKRSDRSQSISLRQTPWERRW